MEFLMFIGTAYAVLYVLWLLVMVVSGMPQLWLNITLFFILMPVMLVFSCTIMLIAFFLSPFILFFSAKARQEFRDKMREQGLN